MIEAIVREIELTNPFNDTGDKISSIYFGGGTPSILPVSDIKLILEKLYEKFNIDSNAEITLEANPDDIVIDKPEQWLDAGINRLSLGVQSFVEPELVWMNRAHHAEESLQSIKRIRDAGFSNFSADLIYGSQLQSNDDLARNLTILFEEDVPHISCYALTMESNTALFHQVEKKGAQPIDAEKQAAQFFLLMEKMEANGYEHYEISNYAKPGMRSKHNSNYWLQSPAGFGIPYYGFGPSAHSFDGNKKRKWNIANNALYIKSIENNLIPTEEETLTDVQKLNEYIMTSLRTIEGINMRLVLKDSGKPHYDTLVKLSKKYIDSGKLVLKNDSLILTKDGKLFADGIAADLFF